MPTVAVHSFTDEDLLRFANQVKEVLLASLTNEEVLDFDSTEEYERFCASYVVVVSRPGMFGRLWDKVFGAENSSIVTVLRSTLPKHDSNVPSLRLLDNQPKSESE